jgi:hypothetical protein
MKEQANTSVENLVDKMMKSSTLESPSVDFTSQILSKIETLQQSKTTVYQPLISKKIWVLIISGCIALVVYAFFSTSSESSSWLSTVDYSKLPTFNISERLSTITFSKTMMYALVLLSLMVFVQIPLLKNYYDKRD